MAYVIKVTDKEDVEFISLIQKLDKALAKNNGKEQAQYNQWNNLDHILEVVLVIDTDKNKAIGCGAYKELLPGNAEIKRVFVDSAYRRNGIGSMIMNELECLLLRRGYEMVWLETGVKQNEAQNMYIKRGYNIIDNYGQYKGLINSVCMQKQLKVQFPHAITQLPMADLPIPGANAHMAQGDNFQILFMSFEEDVALIEHSHKSQYGIVLDGKIELTIDGFQAVYKKGDCYYIPDGVKHSGFIYKGYKDITFFAQSNRYKTLESNNT